MEYDAFLERVIADGLAAAKRDYADRAEKLTGAIAGFEACRGKDMLELTRLLRSARDRTRELLAELRLDDTVAVPRHNRPLLRYWEARCYEAEIEWVCNVVSAALHTQRLPTIVTPTARGMLKAADILGVAGANA